MQGELNIVCDMQLMYFIALNHGKSFSLIMEQLKAEVFKTAFEMSHESKTATADLLGVSRGRLTYKSSQYFSCCIDVIDIDREALKALINQHRGYGFRYIVRYMRQKILQIVYDMYQYPTTAECIRILGVNPRQIVEARQDLLSKRYNNFNQYKIAG